MLYAKFSLLYISTNNVAYSQPHPNKGTCSATNPYIFPLGKKESTGFLRYIEDKKIGIIKIIQRIYKRKYEQNI